MTSVLKRRGVLSLAAAAWALPSLRAHAARAPIRLAHIHSRSGPLQSYGQQTSIGLAMGLEYATGGSLQVAGRPLVLTEADDEGRPERGQALLEQAYADGADLAIGPTSSAVALALLPVAQAQRKLLLVEPAVADIITGERWNRYIFRTARNSSQDAIANAIVLDHEGLHLATLAQDSPFGRSGVAAFRAALRKAEIVHEEYVDTGRVPDVGAIAQRLIERLRGRTGRKVVWILWAGDDPPFALADHFKRHGIELATVGNTLGAMVQFNRMPGMQGAAYYYYAFSRNTVNLWLVTQHFLRYGSPPDMFTAGGFAAAMAIVSALRATQGDTDPERLVAAMEGLRFETPKGWMQFRAEDHQALQSMYHFRVSSGAFPGSIPDLKLVREIPPAEIDLPIRNRRKTG
ncbi:MULTISPECIES: substrate-binding domain-containing protein [Caldimonas]|uniref:substrate-binding domain-containing protein n=1 Tax=Caldimonas TaxID=196013 RepID=UPI000363A761|nr:MULTISPECIES: substrate-binding domain-containing protein [Caldimonas]